MAIGDTTVLIPEKDILGEEVIREQVWRHVYSEMYIDVHI